MKFIDKSREQKECRKFTISNESKKSQALQFKQAREKSRARNPRGPASQASLAGRPGNAKKGQNREKRLLSVSAEM